MRSRCGGMSTTGVNFARIVSMRDCTVSIGNNLYEINVAVFKEVQIN